MDKFLQDRMSAALAITREASQISLGYFKGDLFIEAKSDESPVTIADQKTESYIREKLQELFPQDGIFGEEHGATGLDCENLWVIDPIDGTRSFITGVPLFGMLVAFCINEEAKMSICRLPALDQIYTAIAGGDALLNGQKIMTSGQNQLSEAMLFINEGEKLFAQEPSVFKRLLTAGKFRRLSYDCQPHLLLAEGKIDVVVDYDLKPYDYYALAPVIEQAGGVITDWQGQKLGMNSDGRVLSAASSKLHAEMLDLLR